MRTYVTQQGPRASILAMGGLLGAAGCLDMDTIPVRDAAPEAGLASCDERRGGDPLFGSWQHEDGSVCEFFSNGRYSDCGFLSHASGFAQDWTRLEDGRYYFGFSSLGSHAGECTGSISFDAACNQASFLLSCNRGAEQSMELTRL